MVDDSKILYGGPEPEFIGKIKSLGGFILEKLTENDGRDGLVCYNANFYNQHNIMYIYHFLL